MNTTPKSPARKRKAKLKKPEPGTANTGADKRSSITPEKLSLFLQAIENGFTLKEALLEAKMNDMQYRRLLKRSSNFRAQMEAAEMKLVMLARSKVASAINSADMPTVRWYLERKRPEEFRPAFGDGDVPVGLPPGTVIVLPGSRPHPRIVPE